METSNRPRHRIRAQGRRQGAVLILDSVQRRLKWHPAATDASPSPADKSVAAPFLNERPLELIEFLSLTALQSEKELLGNFTDFGSKDGLSAVSGFRRVIANARIKKSMPSADHGTTGGAAKAELSGPLSGAQSSRDLKELLAELDDWFSGKNSAVEISRTAHLADSSKSNQAKERQQDVFGFEQAKDWLYADARKDLNLRAPSILSTINRAPIFTAASYKSVNVRNLSYGRRLERHENGATVEKDELGRVTEIRSFSGEIIRVLYSSDGSAEGFVRTSVNGSVHSSAYCDSSGVMLRDQTGRVRAAGDSLSIDPVGRISISCADGQFWSIDLVRQMLSEKRRLSDKDGRWTALTGVFAADGFRMMTLFQRLRPGGRNSAVYSLEDANRLWMNAAVESGQYRFYGRDGSGIQFDSEEELANLSPAHVSVPGVRIVEPRWIKKRQAGTAWQSVQEYVVSYLAV